MALIPCKDLPSFVLYKYAVLALNKDRNIRSFLIWRELCKFRTKAFKVDAIKDFRNKLHNKAKNYAKSYF